ncbi:TlpA family protein disulfide reductase [bacterium]|nr:TlpA family protein disulfide reductase [bacterium]MBU1959343.1 TlpA family protein disulfide reductase [bacterium]
MFKTVNTLLLLLLLSACSSQEGTEQKENSNTPTKQSTIEPKATEVSKPESVTSTKEVSPETSLFTLKTITGKELHIDETVGGLTFQEYKEKVVLVIFFGHRCPPCLAEIPVLKALKDKGHNDLEIVALEVQGNSEEQLKAFQERTGINYHLITGKNHYEFIDYIAQKANWTGSIPFLIGFNKKSEVKVVHVGGVNAQQFDNIYDTLSKE